MRSDVAPVLWLSAATVFAVAWKSQDRGVYLAIAIVLGIMAVRSYAASHK